MRKMLCILFLSCAFLLISCKENAQNTNVNTSSNSAPKTVANLASGNDLQVKQKIEENWKKVGCIGATVEVKDGLAIARGNVPKGKMRECVQAAQEAGPGKFQNELTESK